MNNVSCQYTGVQDVIFNSVSEAEEVLKAMRDICEEYEYVTVADFKDLADISVNYRDNKYGWVKANLSVAQVVSVMGGHKIDILPAMYLEISTPRVPMWDEEKGEFVPYKEDPVNHPSHYKSKAGLETIDVIDAFTADLTGTEAVCTANVIKYICRWKHKNGLQDLEKAKWYLEHLINHMKKETD